MMEEPLQLGLILAGVHGLPESVMPERIQSAQSREGGHHVGLEVLTFPVVEHRPLEGEEAGVNPVVTDDRLLVELRHLSLRAEPDVAILRTQGYGGQGAEPT